MTTYVAFLRGINLGKRNVKMDVLRGLFEELGFRNVKTVIASGNVVFDAKPSKALAQKIEKHLEASLGYDVRTFLRTMDDVERIRDAKVFDAGERDQLYVAFLEREPDAAAMKRLAALGNAHDVFAVRGTEVYWLRREGSETLPAGFLEKPLGQLATMRNMNTVVRITAAASRAS
jgi:uncharacterized protein (DUF1697 family)